MRLGRQFFMSTLGECNYLRYTKPCIFDNSRCRGRLIANDDASMHPLDQDFVTRKGIHPNTNNTKRQTVFALLMAADKVNRIFSPTQVSAGWQQAKKTNQTNHLR